MADVDWLMERASRALVEMDYLAAEAACVAALRVAKQEGDWERYARAVLPLQEARRQRRMIAADTAIVLGTAEGVPALTDGCVLLTYPHQPRDAAARFDEARNAGRFVVTMYADCAAAADVWTLRTMRGPAVSIDHPAPPVGWRNRVLRPDEPAPPEVGNATTRASTPGHWFIAAHEALGDAALAAVGLPLGSVERLEALEDAIAGVGDHEILHQRLADAARALITTATFA